MYLLKGFGAIDALASNATNAVSSIGELSQDGFTYARDVGIYSSSENSGQTIYAFTSKQNSVKVTIPSDIKSQTELILNWIYQQRSQATSIITKTAFLTQLSQQFSAQCELLDCGNIVENNGKYYPQYFSYKLRTHVEDNSVKIWLSDTLFRQEYDDYELVVVPPVALIDSFFNSGPQVVSMINGVRPSELLDRIQAARASFPPSAITANDYQYIDPTDSTVSIWTSWSVLIYGIAGNDSDKIKAAIQEYITANSTRSPSQWASIFPYLFKSTELVIIPFWKNIAIAEQSLVQGIYSPVSRLGNMLAYFKNKIPDDVMDDTHIQNNLQSFIFPYKSIVCGVIGSKTNDAEKYRFSQVYPDYIGVATTSLDYMRQSQTTQRFCDILANMLPVAESMTTNSFIPAGMRRITRDDIMYLTSSIDGVDILVAAKSTLPS